MYRFLALVGRFGRDESGVFAVLFGLMAVVLIALGGAGVDYVALQQARSRAQVALDAAALALQPQIFKASYNEEAVRVLAEAIVLDRIGNSSINARVDGIETSIADGSLYLHAEFSMPTIFVSLVGVPTLGATVEAKATRKMLKLEVAMVLDNSGSMGSFNRMTYLKEAARCATRIMFYGEVDEDCDEADDAEAQDNVKIGIVPFTMMVNIGTQFSNATWLDWTGQNSISQLNFDNDDNASTPFAGPVNRKTLFTQTGTSWRGCVEARRAPYDTDDTAPSTTATLFTPMFSPDTTLGNYNSYMSDTGGTCQVKTCTEKTVRKNCTYSWWGGWSCSGATTNTYTKKVGSTTTTPASSCVPANAVVLSASGPDQSGSTLTTTTTYSLLTERELQERLCKYNGTTVSDGKNSGPNAYCPSISVLPLTDNVDNVLARINAMNADGGTNIQQGAMWGFHALSSTEPLTQAAAYSSGAVSKVMILMTDGFNEPDYRSYDDTWNGTGVYYSWGFRKDGRLPDTDGTIGNENEYAAHNSKADMSTTMDQKTVATCTNAKAEGIRVYTIGLNPPSQATRDMLQSCSSGDGYYFFPEDPSDLVDVFAQIANQLAQLRLAL